MTPGETHDILNDVINEILRNHSQTQDKALKIAYMETLALLDKYRYICSNKESEGI